VTWGSVTPDLRVVVMVEVWGVVAVVDIGVVATVVVVVGIVIGVVGTAADDMGEALAVVGKVFFVVGFVLFEANLVHGNLGLGVVAVAIILVLWGTFSAL